MNSKMIDIHAVVAQLASDAASSRVLQSLLSIGAWGSAQKQLRQRFRSNLKHILSLLPADHR